MTQAKPRSAPPRRQTIIRRKRTTDFTVLGNTLINDERLALDEMGAAVKLISLPHDWQIHPGQLRKKWKMGREKFYRIFGALIRAGYVVRGDMIQDEKGRFTAIEYIVYDEPQAPPAGCDDDPFFDGDDGEDGEDGAGDVDGGGADIDEVLPARRAPSARATLPAGEGMDQKGVASLPHAGFPHAAAPHAADPTAEQNKETNKNLPLSPSSFSATPLPTTAPPVGRSGSGPPADAHSAGKLRSDAARAETTHPLPGPPPQAGKESSRAEAGERIPTLEDFLRVCGVVPIARVRVARRWLRLGDIERRAAVAGWPLLKAERAAQKWRMPDPATFLKDRMWERFADRSKNHGVLIECYSPQWYRWRAYRLATGQPVKFMESYARERRGQWCEPAEWPPPLPPTVRSGAPPPLMTDDDERFLAEKGFDP